jgi:uncharacterized protein YjgD (DUF1641 family)
MNNEQQILDQLDQLGQDIAILTDSARSLRELRDDLSPRVNETVKRLITELAQIEGDFQLEDLLTLLKNLMRNIRNLTWTLEQLKSLVDFLRTVEPLLRSSVPQAIYQLDQLEQKGVFQIFSSMMGAMQKVAETYSPEDFQQIADGLVPLVGIVKRLTAPEPLHLLTKLAEVPTRVDLSQATPVGPFGMLFALRDPQMKQALGVALELTKGLASLKEESPAEAQAVTEPEADAGEGTEGQKEAEKE